MPRTTQNLRAILFEEIDAIRAKRSSVQQANAIARLAYGIVESAKLELAAQQLVAQGQAVSIDGQLILT